MRNEGIPCLVPKFTLFIIHYSLFIIHYSSFHLSTVSVIWICLGFRYSNFEFRIAPRRGGYPCFNGRTTARASREALNPKHEIRNKKQNLKIQNSNKAGQIEVLVFIFCFGHCFLVIWICLGLRYSNFEFRIAPRRGVILVLMELPLKGSSKLPNQ